ncbi:MAG: cbb3-type cytochrome oxidase assembly protein CcoS [Sulfurospirillaceae bacterium]|nr:cbb3-type cytochrome oxidase assembly protein CcoS [Sulfurospirillaceae bacterium]MDD3462257.1 cbb3-type cytochrome oxidase assembly protein CcoS [Sulfurospirillaceae bacterium]
MDVWVVAMMLGVSILLGALGLVGLLWGLKNGQFDDREKFLNGTSFDSEEALNDAISMEKKKDKILEEKRKTGYRPPD